MPRETGKAADRQIGRLQRDFRFLETMRNCGVKFAAADLPQANHLNVHHFISAEQNRRKLISLRVREGLADAKRRGVVLGRYASTRHALRLGPAASAVSRTKAAQERAANIMRHINHIRGGRDLSLREIARALNEHGHKAPRGGEWSAAQVRAIIGRCQADQE